MSAELCRIVMKLKFMNSHKMNTVETIHTSV